ncbi:hypothetical protein Lser_V15G34238 [Lactuca serriola]
MEATLSAAISNTLDCSGQTLRNQLTLLHPPRINPNPSAAFRRSSVKFGLRNAGAAVSSAASFSSPSDNGRKVKVNPIAAAADDVSPLSPDVIVLDVTGMTCGGCSSSVQRILENQAQVASANVNLETATAIVLPVSEATTTPNWKKVIGEDLAKHLTTCGFTSTLKEG